ncbi:MAG: hypothetical protein QG670_1961 [Thermoproteota archaeon]|nr:hypothetical protein [Thermoproteota archaeon]
MENINQSNNPSQVLRARFSEKGASGSSPTLCTKETFSEKLSWKTGIELGLFLKPYFGACSLTGTLVPVSLSEIGKD